MIIIIIIFFVAIILAFGMLTFRAWEIRTLRINIEDKKSILSEIQFRQIKRSMLYFVKHIILSIVLIVVKYWFIITTKIKKWFSNKWPKINDHFKNNYSSSKNISYNSFVKHAILESKIKIKRIKEKVKREHE